MKTKMIAAVIVALFVAGMFFALPVLAGPYNAPNKIKVDYGDGELVLIVSKRGFRQWYYEDGEIVHFCVCLFTAGMNDKAIQAHLDDGWLPHAAIVEPDTRTFHVGGQEFIYKLHYIPAGP